MRENSGSTLTLKLSADRIPRSGGFRRGLADPGQVPNNPLVEAPPLVGEDHRAARSVQQSGAEACLELRDRTADARLRHPQAFRGTAEAACIGNRNKNHETTDKFAVNLVQD